MTPSSRLRDSALPTSSPGVGGRAI
jgi:hypothetical protein